MMKARAATGRDHVPSRYTAEQMMHMRRLSSDPLRRCDWREGGADRKSKLAKMPLAGVWWECSGMAVPANLKKSRLAEVGIGDAVCVPNSVSSMPLTRSPDALRLPCTELG